MSDHVLMDLLNELRETDKIRSILSLFRNELNKFSITRARMLDSIHQMTLKSL